MREPNFESLAAYVEGAVRQPEFAVIRQRATKVNRRRAFLSSAAALVIALTATSIGYAAADGGPPEVDPMPAPTESPDPPGLWPRVGQVVATGSGTLYAAVEPCRRCATELHASDDDGATWQARPVPPKANGITDSERFASMMSLGPDTIAWRDVQTMTDFQELFGSPAVAGGDTPGPGEQTSGPGEQTSGPGEQTSGTGKPRTGGFYTSVDGGRSWRQAVVDPPVAATPPGGRVFGCSVIIEESPCRIYAVDPGTGHFAPLATQPAGILIESHWPGMTDVPLGGRLWVPGLDPATRKPAVATSADGGRTWKTHVFTAGVPAVSSGSFTAAMYLPFIAANNGKVAYALLYRDEAGRRTPYRTTDGGATWRPVSGGPLPDGTEQGFVTTDGAHVTRTGTTFRVARPGAGYRTEKLPGYPAEMLDPNESRVPSQQAAGHYLVNNNTHAYLSGNGWSWKRADLP
ncbi:sialidase family protein [Paractinoplanes rishiriensis]|uniref:Uncharacterized protein n=1 Tax=Paractinoplanes rishiriensis TaxID=1050105 RepID=A0A919JXB6_9ACTN|nr:sialidase family protein [Actinoplanes rishiriensis]GIE95007.1 hypothetical protein Ari01nite_24720 [Actinoplanes rishiriensis]